MTPQIRCVSVGVSSGCLISCHPAPLLWKLPDLTTGRVPVSVVWTSHCTHLFPSPNTAILIKPTVNNNLIWAYHIRLRIPADWNWEPNQVTGLRPPGGSPSSVQDLPWLFSSWGLALPWPHSSLRPLCILWIHSLSASGSASWQLLLAMDTVSLCQAHGWGSLCSGSRPISVWVPSSDLRASLSPPWALVTLVCQVCLCWDTWVFLGFPGEQPAYLN